MNFFEIVLAFLIGLHAFFMIIDEFYFHMKRILPKWERIGHPLDTLFFLAWFVVVIFFSMTKMSIIFYIILLLLETLSKDDLCIDVYFTSCIINYFIFVVVFIY